MAGTYISNIPGLNREIEGNASDTSMIEILSRFGTTNNHTDLTKIMVR